VTGRARGNPPQSPYRRSGWVAGPGAHHPEAGAHAAESALGQPSPGPLPAGPVHSTVTIGQFFGTLRRRLPLLLTCVVLGLVLATVLLVRTPKTYQATAVVDISPTSSSGTSSSVSTITESRIATSASVALAAKQTLAFTGTPGELARKVAVSSPLASQVLNITFTADSARGAADGANAFAKAYLEYRRLTAQREITLRIGRIQSQVADLQKSLAALKAPGRAAGQSGQTALLQNQIQQLQTQLNTYQTSVITPGQVAGDAAPPSAPSSPKPLLYLTGGLLLGLLLGMVLAVMRDRRDDRVLDSGDLEHSLGAPAIAEAESAEVGPQPTVLAAIAAARSSEADAYRTVTTTVTSDAADSRVIVLCGTGHDGPSLAPLNLAATFALQGLTTVIAGPRQAVEPARELVDVREVPAAGSGSRLVDQLAPSELVPGLFVLSLGDEVALGAALRANGDTLDEVLSKVDVIVLDGVNIELPSTSLRLGQLADEAVVVAYKNRSTHSDIERLARHLAQVRATVLGGILLSRRSGVRLKLRGRPAEPAPRRSAARADRERDDVSPARTASAVAPQLSTSTREN
jgi:succinoglycan biosynthesis transport protein ExoP